MVKNSSNQSLERGFLVLRIVATEPLRLSQIAARAGLAKSTTSRMLASLARLGAVRIEGDRFFIGPAISQLARGLADEREELRKLAAPVLRRLADDVGEHATLAIAEGTEVIYLAQEHSYAYVSAGDWTGARHELHGSAFGLVLLAFLPEDQLDQYLLHPLQPYTDNTETDPRLLRARIEEIRRNHVAWAYEEFARDVNGCAVPVLRGDVLIASVGCFGPAYRFPQRVSADEVQERVFAAAKDLGQLVSAPISLSHPMPVEARPA